MKTTKFMDRLFSSLRVRVSNIKSQLLLFMIKNWLFVKFFSTVERGPTLSAGYKIPPRQRKLHLLPDLIVLVVGLSKCKGSAAEIAQFPLGDLTIYTPLLSSRYCGTWAFVAVRRYLYAI